MPYLLLWILVASGAVSLQGLQYSDEDRRHLADRFQLLADSIQDIQDTFVHKRKEDQSGGTSNGFNEKRAQEETVYSDEQPDGEGIGSVLHENSLTSSPSGTTADIVIMAVLAGCGAAGVLGLVMAGVCWYRYNKKSKEAETKDYHPSYGVTGPITRDSSSGTGGGFNKPIDSNLAQSAEIYHYQHQKQQMKALEKASSEAEGAHGSSGEDGHDEDDDESGDENGDEDTVYECPGLASMEDMEVRNPLFNQVVVQPEQDEEEKHETAPGDSDQE